MPQDRTLLLMSMALQGAVALTFGLAFIGFWRGFQRPAGLKWAVAWLVYAFGVTFAAVGIGLQFVSADSAFGRTFLIMPPIFGVLLLRAGTDSLVEPRARPYKRYAIAMGLVFLLFLVFLEFEGSGLVSMPPSLPRYILPRIVMGVSYAWVLWPLRGVVRRRWAEGFGLMAVALVALSVRMFASAGYEVFQIANGAGDRPESPLLTILQVSLLIMFGVATALVLVEAERLEAVRSAETIRQTADALRASEARFRFVVEHASDIQVIVDPNHRIRYVAPSSERLLGKPPAWFEGKTLVELMHPDDREKVGQALGRMHADPTGRRPPTAVLIQHQSGEWMPFDVSGQLVNEDPHSGPSMVLSIRDMTAQRKLEDVLMETRRLDSLGRMAGNVAHDFNNVLTAVSGGLEVLSEQVSANGAAIKSVDVVRRAASRGSDLTRQLLTFARQMPAAAERFDVRDRLAALDPVVAMAVGRAVRLRIELAEHPSEVHADPGQFDQVILNLAINARDAMPAGGDLTIQSRLAPLAPSSDGEADVREAVRIVVSDTGVGIPPAIVHRIFEPFFTTKGNRRGTGLGLASAYGFARQAGGRLTVESTEGVGTHFYLDLPLDNRAATKSGAISPPGIAS